MNILLQNYITSYQITAMIQFIIFWSCIEVNAELLPQYFVFHMND